MLKTGDILTSEILLGAKVFITGLESEKGKSLDGLRATVSSVPVNGKCQLTIDDRDGWAHNLIVSVSVERVEVMLACTRLRNANEALGALDVAHLGVGATMTMQTRAAEKLGSCFLGFCREGKLDMDFAAFSDALHS